ncbi:MAG TPA: ABC transporter permease [Gammaproteobacteria bacterium]|nr:ABC transporter permease [Gammaproteobacteria bacterium]
MNGLLTDIGFGLKLLVSRPGFSAAAILTLALGIGANTAVFSVLNGYLLKPLPYPHGEQLVQIDESEPKSGIVYGHMSIPIYFGIREHVSAFSDTGLFRAGSFHIESNGEAALVPGAQVTPSVFNVLGVKPLVGETFAPEAAQPGRGHELVLSYNFWQQRFGGKSNIVGTTIRIAGEAYRVTGVMPKGFAFPNRSVQFWKPWTITAADRSMENVYSFNPRMIGRYRTGADVATAYRQLDQVWAKLGPVPAQEAEEGIVAFTLTPWRHIIGGDKSSTALLLQAAVLFLLLITCVNVANLLLSRILGRTHEIALRAALGASRLRLARQLLIEGISLALPGGVVGVALGWWSLNFFAGSAIGPGNDVFSLAPDWRVAGFAVAVVVLTSLVISLLPLWHLGRTDLAELLQEGGRVSGGRRARRIRQALAVTELGLAAVLLTGAGLLLHSLMQVQAVDPGYRLDHVLLANLDVPSNEYKDPAARVAFYHEAQRRLAALPGVKTVALTSVLPFGDHSHVGDFAVHSLQSGNPSLYIQTVGKNLFNSLNIPILRGRGFDGRDTPNSRPVVVINRKLAQAAFGDADPLGQQIQVGDDIWRTVVGVVPTVKTRSLSRPIDRGTAYLPLTQGDAMRAMGLMIETSIPAAKLAGPLRALFHQIDPSVVLYNVKPIHRRMLETLQQRQATMGLVLIFGGIALALAFVGVYGVLSYAVRQRTAECGVRLALGAEPHDLLWLILRDGLLLLAFGLGSGLVLAVALGYIASSQLFEVAPFDPATLAGVALVLSAATLLACYLPARRAARLDPIDALHYE